MSNKRYSVVDDGFFKYIQDNNTIEDHHETNITNIYELCDTLNKQDKQIQEFISYFESQNKEKKELEFKLHTLRKWYTCRDCAFSEKELKYLRSLEE